MKASRDSLRAVKQLASSCLLAVLSFLILWMAPASGAESPGKHLLESTKLTKADSPSALRLEHGKEDTRVPGHYIVVLKDSVEHPLAIAEEQTKNHNGDLGFVYRYAIKGYSAELSKDAVEALRESARVKYVAPDRQVEAFGQTIPTGVRRIGDTENATAKINGVDERVNVDVAVIDTGIDYTHTDLNVYRRANCVPAGENPQAEGSVKACAEGAGTDLNGHGTHVAGTIGALDNGEGVVGVAPGARLWSVRALNREGAGSESWVVAAVDWVKAHASEIEVANMSLGCSCEEPALEEAINSATSAGVVFSVAAGNSGSNSEGTSPAKNLNVITVSALSDYDGKPGSEAVALIPTKCESPDEDGEHSYGSDDTLAWFSNWGPPVDVAAPGVCILSTLPGEAYGYESGTSMASPHVAGAAALLASKSNPNSKSDVEAIRSQIVNEGSQNWNDIWTYGSQLSGVEEPGYGEGAYDSTQEPVLDVSPQVGTTYTTRATERKRTAATLNGGINPNGAPTSYQFEYGSTASYGAKLPASPVSVGAGTKDVKVSQVLSGLVANTTYHYRLVSTGSSGTKFGADKTLETATSFWTFEAKEVEASSANLRAGIIPGGIETTYQFEYLTDADLQSKGWTAASKVPASPKSAGAGSEKVFVNQLVEALKPNTAYDYRVTITNKNGTYTGEDKKFATPVAVETRPATGVDGKKARLEARANPMGVPTTVQFEWGTNKTYGHVIPSAPLSIGSGIKIKQVNQVLENLKPNTTYHYRVAVTSSTGTSFGEDEVFTTATSALEADTAGKVAILDGATSCAECNADRLELTTLWGINNAEKLGSLETSVCSRPTVSGEIKGSAESVALSMGSLSCLSPYVPQRMEGGLNMGACQLELHPGHEGRPGEFRGSADIGGANCTGLVASFSSSWCTITIPPQNGIPAVFSEVAQEEGFPIISVRVSGEIAYSQLGALCPDGSFNGGHIYAQTHLRARSANGEFVGLHLVHLPEAAVTKEASSVTSSGATLNGTVNPGGIGTTYQFEYVDSSHYEEEALEPYAAGSRVPGSPVSAGSGSTDVSVSQSLSGLKVHETYHFRLAIQNSEGTTYGRDKTFTTLPKFVASFGAPGEGNGQLNSPGGLAVDGAGHLWVADTGNNRIEEFDRNGNYLGQFGSYGIEPGKLKSPNDVAISPDGNILVLDAGNYRVEKFDPSGKFLTQFGSHGDEGGEFDAPSGIAVSPDGHIWVSDAAGFFQEFSGNGEFLGAGMPENGYFSEPGLEHHIWGAAADAEGHVWVADAGYSRMVKDDSGGHFLFMAGKGVNTSGEGDPDTCTSPVGTNGDCVDGAKGSSSPAELNEPRAVETEPSGAVLVVDSARVQEFSSSGGYMTQFAGGGQLGAGSGISTDSAGNIFIADASKNLIQKWCSPHAPEVSGSLPNSVKATSAVLGGVAVPGCQSTTYQFEYGTTQAYGSKVPSTPKDLGSTVSDTSVTTPIEGLSPHTTYHYRLVLNNATGSAYGKDLTFTTPPRRPATGLEGENYPVSILGQQDPNNKLGLQLEANRSVGCEKANLNAASVFATSEPRLKPEYQGCTIEILGNADLLEILPNSCEYTMGIANTAPPYSATFGIACAKEGDGIELKAYASKTAQAEGKTLCVYKFGPKSGLKGVALSNFGSGTERGVSAKLESISVPYTKVSGTVTNCGAASASAILKGTSNLMGTSASQAAVGIDVSTGEQTQGFFVAGEKEPKFEAEKYPVAVTGEQSATDPQTIEMEGIRKARCGAAYLDTSRSAAASSLGLKPEYQGCTIEILGNADLLEILPNSCEYTMGIANTAPPYSATFGIACAKEGDGIELKAYASKTAQAEGKTLCVYKFGPKSGLKGVALSNFGSGTERGVSAKLESISVPYTKVSGTVTNCGAASASAILKGTSNLRGF